MPFWGPLITGVLGVGLGAYFQDRNWRHEREHLRAQWQLRTASNLARDIGHGANARIYRLHELHRSIREPGADRAVVEEKWRAHLAAKETWDIELRSRLVQVELYFGLATRWLLERSDHPGPGQRSGLAPLLEELDQMARAPHFDERGDPSRFDATWHEEWHRAERAVRESIEALNKSMLSALQHNAVALPSWSLIKEEDGK